MYFDLKEIPAASFPGQADDYQFQTALSYGFERPFPTFFCNHQHFVSKSLAMNSIYSTEIQKNTK